MHSINRAPDTLGAVVTLGTLNDGEAIELEGDIDEYSFSGTAGQTVTATLQAPLGFDAVFLQLSIIDPVTGTILGTAQTWDGTVDSTGAITLPATRTYLVRLGSLDDTAGKGGYRFRIQ